MGPDVTETDLKSAMRTGHICADCGDHITYTEECFLIQIVQPQILNGHVYHHHIIDEEEVEGDFLFDPYFFCVDCWESLYDDLEELVEDSPPVVDPMSPLSCSCCGSGIREWEFAGSYTIGEFHRSQRAPNNQYGPQLQPNGPSKLLCLYCLVLVNINSIELWQELSQTGECNDCIHVRCWRNNDNGCSCSCHAIPHE